MINANVFYCSNYCVISRNIVVKMSDGFKQNNKQTKLKYENKIRVSFLLLHNKLACNKA